jgi:hypothetical protein
MGTAFTYQGQLQRSGAPASGSFDFRFKLFDAASGGVQIGSDALLSSVAVSNGLFTVNLDFGAAAFSGSARFLQIEVRPAGGGSYTLLTPRQEVKPQPHALFAANAANAANAVNAGHATNADNAVNAGHATNADNAANAAHAANADNATTASYARKIPLAGTGATTAAARSDHNHFGNNWAGAASNYGLYVNNSSSGDGVCGGSAATLYNYAGLYGYCTSTGSGVFGISVGGQGVYGTSTNGDGVEGTTTNGGKSGVYAHSMNGFGITGVSTNNVAIVARSIKGDALDGWTSASAKSGVYGHSTAGIGVTGISTNNYGVQGLSTNYVGVQGRSTNHIGVYGYSANQYAGSFYSQNYHGLCASSPSIYYYAGRFENRGGSSQPGLYVDGTIVATGSKAGYVVDIAINDGPDSLETGDLVVIVGADTPLVGEIPLIKVRKCTQPQSAAVMGVVDQPFRVSNAEAGEEKEPPGPSAPAALTANGNAIAARQHLSVVTHGAFKTVKADASGGPIKPGDLLVASPTAGCAMKASSPAPGTIIGKALGELAAGAGAIPVMVTLQ